VELVEALAKNKSLSIENRHVIMENFFNQIFFKHWNKRFKRKVGYLYRLIIALFELNYYYSPLIIKAAQELILSEKFSNLQKHLNLLNIFKQIEKDELSDYDVSDIIEALRESLEAKPSHGWRYNYEEERLYTYKEMKAKRDQVDLSEVRQEYQGFLTNDKRDKEVWHEHWVHLCMKRDMVVYMKKLRDLEDQRKPYEIDFENFNPKRWNDNIRVLGNDEGEDSGQNNYDDGELELDENFRPKINLKSTWRPKRKHEVESE
jgi:hypothetical protein